jgi:hypothetical protein
MSVNSARIFSHFHTLNYMMYDTNDKSLVNKVNSVLIFTNCTKTTLERAENVSITINMDKWRREEMIKYGLTNCYRQNLTMSDFLPAFFTTDIADDHYYSTMSTVYDQLPALLEAAQLNLCTRNFTQEKAQ